MFWWKDYRDKPLCIFGHYGLRQEMPHGTGSAFCVDFGVGKRWTERQSGKTEGFDWKLAALRIPEQLVVFDDGEAREMKAFQYW